MEVEDSGGVVLTAYHSYTRSQPPAASHPLSRYGTGRDGPGRDGTGAGPGRVGQRVGSGARLGSEPP